MSWVFLYTMQRMRNSKQQHVFRVVGLALIVCAAFLSACATAPARRSSIPYRAEGMASWYGPGFQGRKTASGEHYNQRALTAAHRTLPFGTSVKVTNLDNGKSIIVRINDRGPVRRDRLIDLSRAAAEKLDLIHEGTGRVEVSAVGVINTHVPNVY